MTNFKFPDNPNDGDVFEASIGVFFQFSSATNCWILLEGFDGIPVATPIQDGLMSPEDFCKVSGLLVPPPKTNLSSQDCETVFDSGIISFRSSKGHLKIGSDVELRASGTEGTQTIPFRIHGDTFGYDFRIILDKLVEELEKRGNIRINNPPGEKGEKGDRGEPGIDELDTGPIGDSGEDGANTPFIGTLTPDPARIELTRNENRAVVDIKTETISKSENFLVVTRAIMGNPLACPDLIKPKDFKTPWVLAVDDTKNVRISKEETSSGIVCQICDGPLHYIDITSIFDAVQARFDELVAELIETKKENLNHWLSILINIFNETKSAICCALENVQSKQRNQDARRYIEQQRIQAAQSDHKLLIDGLDKRQEVDMDAFKECISEEGGGFITGPNDCSGFELQVIGDGIANAGNESNAVIAPLDAGNFIAEVVGCCASRASNTISPLTAELKGINYTGRVGFAWETSNGPEQVFLPDLGDFATNEEAQAAYLGFRFSFSHTGGDVKMWIPDKFPQDNTGSIILGIKRVGCFAGTGTEEEGAPTFTDCQMVASQVRWYERGWRTNNTCAVFVEVSGMKFIVAKRSLGTDLTCGGGESLSTECISRFIDAQGHPAIAFPSIDGEEFAGIPESGLVTFVIDEALNNEILAKIVSGDILIAKGDPSEISVILFPTSI